LFIKNTGEFMSEEIPLSRRSFMSMVIWAIGGIIGAVFGIPAIAYIVGPALKRDQQQDWIQLGPISKVELNTPTLFKTTLKKQTGWIINEEEITVYILTENGRDYVALSNICTHLGCRVRWIADDDEFFCPCHNAVFDKNGEVVTGPPPRPLDRYEVKIENDHIFVLGG
jgi:menaquinol-cytochrome c reductase iron-sulfur subunit